MINSELFYNAFCIVGVLCWAVNHFSETIASPVAEMGQYTVDLHNFVAPFHISVVKATHPGSVTMTCVSRQCDFKL